MRFQELGYEIRRARLAQGLTQAQLAREAKLSRTTLNQFENGLFSDLGVRKVQAILENLGLGLSVQQVSKVLQPDFIRMACTTANVSYKDTLTEDELVYALLTGKVAVKKRPHFRTILDEASPILLKGLIQEVSRWTKPGRVEKNLARIAEKIGSSRRIGKWTTTA